MYCDNCVDGFPLPCDNKDCINHTSPANINQHRYVGYEGTCLDCHEEFFHYNHKNTKCMRLCCPEERFEASCLCQEHTKEVLRGEAKAPPLRRNIDYVTPMRPALVYDYYPEHNEQMAPKARNLIWALRKLVRDFKDKL